MTGIPTAFVPPNVTFLDPLNPYAGIKLDLIGAMPTLDDPYQCPADPSTGEDAAREGDSCFVDELDAQF